jgi:hypothetical protein
MVMLLTAWFAILFPGHYPRGIHGVVESIIH